MEIDLEHVCKQVLEHSQVTLKKLGPEIFDDVSYKTKDQVVTAGDLAVSDAIITTLKKLNFPCVLFDEEAGRIAIHKEPRYTVVTDPIDATKNFYIGKGKVLPYTTVIGIFEGIGDDLKYKDVVCAGIVEHTCNNIWTAQKGKGCFFNGIPIKTTGCKKLTDMTTNLIDFGPIPFEDEGKVPGLRQLYIKLIEKSWVINYSGAGFHLALVAGGVCDSHVIHRQKPDEMTAGFLMIKEAGGDVIDFEGNDWGERTFKFKTDHPAIAAATKEFANEILELKI